jgi:hypothetical protein
MTQGGSDKPAFSKFRPNHTDPSFGHSVCFFSFFFVLLRFLQLLSGATAIEKTSGGSDKPALSRFRPNDKDPSFRHFVSFLSIFLYFLDSNY